MEKTSIPRHPARSLESWTAEVRSYRASGLSFDAYAVAHNINGNSLRTWTWRVEHDVKRKPGKRTSVAGFVPLRVAESQQAPSPLQACTREGSIKASAVDASESAPLHVGNIEILLRTGHLIRIATAMAPPAIAQLVRALEAPC